MENARGYLVSTHLGVLVELGDGDVVEDVDEGHEVETSRETILDVLNLRALLPINTPKGK